MQQRAYIFRWITGLFLMSALLAGGIGGAALSARAAPLYQANALDVVINEIAWGGTVASEADQWIELFNPSSATISLVGWRLVNEDSSFEIEIPNDGNSYEISAGGYFLLERENDNVIKTIPADFVYKGQKSYLDVGGEKLSLLDSNDVIIDTANSDGDSWPAGLLRGYGSMERYGDATRVYEDSDQAWTTNSEQDTDGNLDYRDILIYGTPRRQNVAASTLVFDTTTTIISHNPNPSVKNVPITITVSVIGGPTTPTGTVTVSVQGASPTCTATLNADGEGSCNITFINNGTRELKATYNGDGSHNVSTSELVDHNVVDPITTTTSITAITPSPGTANQNVTFTVKVVPESSSENLIGTVEITSDNLSCTINLNKGNGNGSCSIKYSTTGPKDVTATYLGAGAYTSSKDTDSVDIFEASTTTITADSPDPSNTNQPVSVTVRVTGGTILPTGEVEITGANSNCTITLNNGTGSCNVNFSYSGTRTITATYEGDNRYSGSVDTESHRVNYIFRTAIPPAPTPTPLLGVSEILPRPGYDWNKDGKVDVKDEFIEIINAGSISVDLRNWKIDDEENQGSPPYVLPSYTLAPGERIVYYGSQTNILLEDAGDTVRLIKPNNQIADAYTYSIARYPDQSICRIPDRLGYWNNPCFPTPGNPNSLTGSFSAPPGPPYSYQPPVCQLPDGIPQAFIYAECTVTNGREIWNRNYWDENWLDEQLLPGSVSKSPTILE